MPMLTTDTQIQEPFIRRGCYRHAPASCLVELGECCCECHPAVRVMRGILYRNENHGGFKSHQLDIGILSEESGAIICACTQAELKQEAAIKSVSDTLQAPIHDVNLTYFSGGLTAVAKGLERQSAHPQGGTESCI